MVMKDRMLAGIAVTWTPPVEQAFGRARQECAPYLFNHVVRSWLFAARIAQLRGLAHDGEVLALGALLHDMTLNERFAGPRRFEVEGADLAKRFAEGADFDSRRAQLVWDSVALNSTPSIGLYKEPEVALCTTGICLDVIGMQHDAIPAADMARILEAFPRLGMKEKMSRCFCHIARTRPETTYDNFVRDFGERFAPGYRAPSAVDFVANAPFTD